MDTHQIFELSIDKEDFWTNVVIAREKWIDGVPLDIVRFLCCKCMVSFEMNPDGLFIFDDSLEQTMEDIFNQLQTFCMEEHILECSNDCSANDISLDPDFGYPENLILFFPDTKKAYLTNFNMGSERYEPELLVTTKDSEHFVFALYKREGSECKIHANFMSDNFITNFNLDPSSERVEELVEDLIIDDDSANRFRHLIPRLDGGGRRLHQKHYYTCIWCPSSSQRSSQKGKFVELKNYRDHFRRVHKDIPYSEFLEIVQNRDPKWFCKGCKQKFSLGNVVRHKAICKGRDALETDSETNSDSSDFQFEIEEKTKSKKKYNRINVIESSSDEETQKEASPTTATEMDTDKEKEEVTVERATEQVQDEENVDTCPANADGGQTTDHIEKSIDLEGDIPTQVVRTNLIKRFKKTAEGKYRVIEEGNNNNPKKTFKQTKAVDVTDEFWLSENDHFSADESELSSQVIQGSNTKWWSAIHEELYIDHGYHGMKIFTKDDSKEFVSTVIQNWKIHEAKKVVLDNEREQLENSDEVLKLFSATRDQPIIDQYIEFVQNHSTKDVLRIFSADYEKHSVQRGSKADTAKQYSNRIIEFFNFMAKKYDNFHLDWFTDYLGCIQKTNPGGELTFEIFAPSKSDFTDFVKSFKYGSNPAANVGLRIFAIKKFLEFLQLQYEDNEHKFPGTLKEKSDMKDVLVQKLKNINQGICPDGTIKKISIASNKNHKQSIIDQLKKCPEKSLEKIMEGVSDYLKSEDYSTMKTLLLELAYKKTRIPSRNEYMQVTNWLLEILVCLGGNRPVALLGITIGDWEDRKPGFYPFDGNGDDLVEEDPNAADSRMVTRNPYVPPLGSQSKEPTGIIVRSHTDKISIGAPCYIWFPNELVDLVKAHSMMTSKYMPRTVDLYHPETRLFLNSNGSVIKTIECKHFKQYIGLPITAYDFRRSLATYCLENQNQVIRNAESSVLRHNEYTGFAYYYAKHSNNVEMVNINYAKEHNLIRAKKDDVDLYGDTLRSQSTEEEWDLTQRRTDKALEVKKNAILRRKRLHESSRVKGPKNFILAKEYSAFLAGLDAAMEEENFNQTVLNKKGPFNQLLKYLPDSSEGGVFPVNSVWQRDFCRVLYGLQGQAGDEMRAADLSVYDGAPFSKLSGRLKILAAKDKRKGTVNSHTVIAQYWREKIRDDVRLTKKGYWHQIKFIFNKDDEDYYQAYKKREKSL